MGGGGNGRWGVGGGNDLNKPEGQKVVSPDS